MALIYLEGNIPNSGYARIQVDDGVVAAADMEPERPGAAVLSPGLIDIQLNGFAGIDFSDPQLEPEIAIGVLPHLFRTGVTSFCPTLVTNSRKNLLRNFRVMEQARTARLFRLATPCYHLEGPYLSPEGARGVHDPSLMHSPDWSEFEEIQNAANGNIGIVTVAPELPGAIDFIERAAASGVVVAIGHTDAVPEQIHAAVAAGARLSTHLGNGCPQMLDRHSNPLWAQLAREELSASIICDTFHLPADVVKVVRGMKGPKGTILITDATHAAGMPPGRYRIVGTELELLPNGKLIKADGACLGGSALGMDRAVALYMQLSGAPLAEALASATHSPAKLLEGRGLCAEIAPGEPANLILAHYRPEGLAVEATWLRGEEVYHA